MSCGYSVQAGSGDGRRLVYMEYPSREDVERYTRRVSWDERFIVSSVHFHRGSVNEFVLRMWEMGECFSRIKPFNFDGQLEIDGPAFVRWVEDVIGDKALAESLRAATESEGPYPARLDEMRVSFLARLDQYEEVMAEGGI